MRKLELVSVAMLVWLLPFAAVNTVEGGRQAKPGCSDQCGNVIIKYPFGIGTNGKGENCFLSPAFAVDCDEDGPTLLNAESNKSFIISEIKFPNQVVLQSNKMMAVDCTYTNTSNFTQSVSFNLEKTFTVSAQANRFRAMGCDTTAYINNTAESFTSRCDTQWMISSGAKKHGGLGQCQIAVPAGSSGYRYSVTDQFDYERSACWRNCSFAVLAEEKFEFSTEVYDSYLEGPLKVNTSISYPLVAEWAINVSSCSSKNSNICGENAWCNNTVSETGLSRFHCYCNQDCEGNPYLNGTDGCRTKGSPFPTIPVAIAGGVVLAATLGASSYSYWSWAQKKAIMKLTSKLLQELKDNGDLSSPDAPVDPDLDGVDGLDDDTGPGDITNPNEPNTAGNNPRDFNQQDLKRAIKFYQKARRIAIWAGRRRVARADLPGQGPVDIRKYTVQERSQLPLFVKGVRTLSRTVIHANVARLLGISTRERSLIYKQFSDRTLRDSLHNSPSDRPSWEERLKIALGTARGLAFAHSKGLYHGNVKSSNILLDEKCNCKLVEFGVARVWRKNTLLNSSRGYVDPEYMNLGTDRLIASMDVYSFGVVLVELITGHDPSSKAFNRRGRSSLALVFISAVDEGRLQEVVDHNIWAEERKEQLLGVAELAKECLQQGGKGRPKMQRVRNILSKWAPKDPGPQAQGGRPTYAADRRPGVAQNPDLEGQMANLQGQAQSALDVGQNIKAEDDGDVFES
ncbi:hypothetical protein AAC387_Pa02g1227 [Persea americana]